MNDLPAPRWSSRIRPDKREDWEPFKEAIIRLYWTEKQPLPKVVQAMKDRHNFHATERQYKRRFQDWNLGKNISSENMKAISKIQERRLENAGKDTNFTYRGKPVPQEKIDRYRKGRTSAEEVDHAMSDLDAAVSTPAGIEYETPKPAPISTPSTSSPQDPLRPGKLSPSQSSSCATPMAYHYGGGYPGYLSDGFGPPTQHPHGYTPPSHGYDDGTFNPPTNSFSAGLAFPSTRARDASLPPPTGPQQFGHGMPRGCTFQYSNCAGERKALLIGINYFGQAGQLRGCIDDVRNMASYIVECFGYGRENMVILTDDQQNPMSQPTKTNILRAMHWLVKDAKANDSLFFHYSGYGGQTRDPDGDEPDGYDEVIYPVDFREYGHIADDEMHRIMVTPLPAGVRLTGIFESGHSGTAFDLTYIYSTQGILKELGLAKEAGQGVLGVISSCSQGYLAGVASIVGLFKKALNRAHATETSPADIIMFTGSRYDQNSADATIASQATGGLSWAFITALKKNPDQSYFQLLGSIRDELERSALGPQLSCSHPLDPNLLLMV